MDREPHGMKGTMGYGADPPPSTLAAQIVNNLQRPQTQHQSDSSLQDLLAEILTAGSNAFLDTDLETRYQLVDVLLKACRQRLNASSPFENQTDVARQAVKVLSVVELTVKQSPDMLALSFQRANGHEQDSFTEPMFLWLIPRILYFLGDTYESAVSQAAVAVIQACVAAEGRGSMLKQTYKPVSSYVQGCIGDALRWLEYDCDVRPAIPSENTLQSAWPSYVPGHLENFRIHQASATWLSCLAAQLISSLIPDSTKEKPPSRDLGQFMEIAAQLAQILPQRSLLFRNHSKPCDPFTLLLPVLRRAIRFFQSRPSLKRVLTRAISVHCKLLGYVLNFDFALLSANLQKELCWSLCACLAAFQLSALAANVTAETFDKHLRSLFADPKDWNQCILDLQLSFALTCSRVLQLDHEPLGSYLDRFEDQDLKSTFTSILHEIPGGGFSAPEEAERSRKRIRLTRETNGQNASNPRQDLADFLGGLGFKATSTGIEVPPDAWKALPASNEVMQLKILKLLTASICLPGSCDGPRGCPLCKRENSAVHIDTPVPAEHGYLDGIYFLLSALVTVKPDQGQAQLVCSTTKTRAAAIIALDKLLGHTDSAVHMDLVGSALGQWVSRSLSNRNREIRNAAGRTIRHFVQYSKDRDLCRRNRMSALETLRQLSDGDVVYKHETCIWTMGQIAKGNPGENEMNLILFRLVDYLGHSNPMISSLASDELLRLSSHNAYRAEKLLQPYWKSIAINVIKDLTTKPSAAQRLCDILEISIKDFLDFTKVYTVPYLVLTKKVDILERIATACSEKTGKPVSLLELCLSPDQLPSLLANILMQQSSDSSALITTLLSAVSQDFSSDDVPNLLRADPVSIAFEIFRISGDGDDRQIDRAQSAVIFLADQCSQRQGASSRRSSRKGDALGSFLEANSLAVLKLLSDIVTEVRGPQILPERRRCLASIRHMVAIGRDSVAGAAPQISACLRSAIAHPELCDGGFSAWVTLLRSLSDIMSLIDPTFALIQRYWQSFGVSIQRKAQELLTWLFTEKQDIMQEVIVTVPSLGDTPLLSKYEADIVKFKQQLDQKYGFATFAERLLSEDPLVILRSLEELEVYLDSNQEYLQASSLSEQPDPVVAQLLQSLLDTCVRFGKSEDQVAIRCAKCLGLIGCLDPTRVELTRQNSELLVLSDFSDRDDTIDFIIFLLEDVIVKAFLASMTPRSQNFLGFAMQHLLEICGFKTPSTSRGLEDSDNLHKWGSMSEDTRVVLEPFLNSRYTLKEGQAPTKSDYPIYAPGKIHADWLRELVHDLLGRAQGDNASTVFNICRRIIRGQDLSIASFLLPYIAFNILVGDDLQSRSHVGIEFITVLGESIDGKDQSEKDHLILCSQDVFRTLDYFTRWIQEKKRTLGRTRTSYKEKQVAEHSIEVIETVTNGIPAETMSSRAVECRNYSRGLFYWEQYIRQWREQNKEQLEEEPQSADFLYERLQDIYVQIEEPDGIEGVSAYLQLLDTSQQVLEHRKVGRWSAIQDWNELLLQEEPQNADYQFELLRSLSESGQYQALLNQVAALDVSHPSSKNLRKTFAIEACWSLAQWDQLEALGATNVLQSSGNPALGIGSILRALYTKDFHSFEGGLAALRLELAQGLSNSKVSSLQTCRDALLQFHGLTEIEMIAGVNNIAEEPSPALFSTLEQRLEAVGAFASDKQYLLRLRRAAMDLSCQSFSPVDMSASWLTTARLFRKQGSMQQAFKAILHASQLEDQTVTMEQARLLWKEGNHRKAIQILEGAIAARAFEKYATNDSIEPDEMVTRSLDNPKQNILAAKAQLLLAKWLDQAGQTQSDAIIAQYQTATRLYTKWEKGHYSLGRHYNKLLESERMKPPAKQAPACLTGETAKHVIENFLRSMAYGAKYVHQTLPRILTLWCEMGNAVDQTLDSRYGTEEQWRAHISKNRKMFFDSTMSQLKKYIDRLPAFVFYTAFNQVCARICHTNTKVYQGLADIVVKVCVAHPQQALWGLLAMVRSTARDRQQRGQACIAKVQEQAKRLKSDAGAAEVKALVSAGSRASDQLLNICNADLKKFHRKQSTVSLKDLGFSHKLASPCKLVVPIEATLTASLPTVTDGVNMRQHKAFSKDTVTIEAFLDQTLLLNSLQRPRKVDIRGSDGQTYGLLCKPKDDLRLDQRLLEFNAMIKRSLKKDAESSKRRLYVKTYAVTPLNEECGLIEWVDGLKTHRDIMLKLYQQHSIAPDYREIQRLLEDAITEDVSIFTDKVMGMFPTVFHEWFVDSFPEPEAWYVARLRYTRSCAVMSMLGHVLGLGDRHSENLMIEEGNGGIMHVDFNCLFDKGKTFEKPEKVPFRLTANMVDAFGAYGYEGPFRKASELTMGILRQHEDTLMTILEQFLYDPTIDLISTRKKKTVPDVPNTPEGVLESVRNKVRGLLPEESVPLSVEGHVQYLIQQARDPFRLASMYIGWCAFL